RCSVGSTPRSMIRLWLRRKTKSRLSRLQWAGALRLSTPTAMGKLPNRGRLRLVTVLITSSTLPIQRAAEAALQPQPQMLQPRQRLGVLLHRPLPLLLRLLHQSLPQPPHVEALLLLLQAAHLLAEEVVVLVADVVVDGVGRAQHQLDPSHLIRPRTCSL